MLVLQLTMPTTEVRGFSLSNGPVPTIAVSSSDAVVARIFTLFHELGHVLLAAGGVCLPDPAGASGDDEIEPFCNQFSGALLLPMEMLRSEASLQGLDRLASDADVELRIAQAAKAPTR